MIHINTPRLRPADPLLYTSCVGTCALKQVTNPIFSVFAYLMSIRTPKTVARTNQRIFVQVVWRGPFSINRHIHDPHFLHSADTAYYIFHFSPLKQAETDENGSTRSVQFLTKCLMMQFLECTVS